MRKRVFTYITRKDSLLVFDHVDQQYLNPQVPGGTIEDGEDPEAAAFREATEETGIKQLRVISLLGSFERNLASIGKNEVIHAWFYHLSTEQQTPHRWRHFELEPSGGTDAIEFELYWVPLNNIPMLGGIDNAMLSELRESLRRATSRN